MLSLGRPSRRIRPMSISRNVRALLPPHPGNGTDDTLEHLALMRCDVPAPRPPVAGRPPSHLCSRGCLSGYERALPGCSVEAARTASAVRGDQDHEDGDHCQRQTYSQPGLPVPLGASVVPARVVHLDPPFQGLIHLHEDVPMRPRLSSPLATISPPGRPDLRQEAGADEGRLYAVSARSAFPLVLVPTASGATARPHSGAGPAWRTPTSSRWRRRSAGSS